MIPRRLIAMASYQLHIENNALPQSHLFIPKPKILTFAIL